MGSAGASGKNEGVTEKTGGHGRLYNDTGNHPKSDRRVGAINWAFLPLNNTPHLKHAPLHTHIHRKTKERRKGRVSHNGHRVPIGFLGTLESERKYSPELMHCNTLYFSFRCVLNCDTHLEGSVGFRLWQRQHEIEITQAFYGCQGFRHASTNLIYGNFPTTAKCLPNMKNRDYDCDGETTWSQLRQQMQDNYVYFWSFH